MESSSKNNKSPENDMFSIVDFASSASQFPEDKIGFTLHVDPRSSDIHEFLNTEIHVKTAKYLGLAKGIRTELASQVLEPESGPIPEEENIHTLLSEEEPQHAKKPEEDTTLDDNRVIYKKDGRIIEISVSPEQYKALFSTPMAENKEPDEAPSPNLLLKNPLPDMKDFIRNKAAINVPPDSSIASSIKRDDNLASETLAELHIRQGNNKEAKRIYRKLSLLFPEKSGYFEARIKKLQE